jgi:aspartate beta-hydroxylase
VTPTYDRVVAAVRTLYDRRLSGPSLLDIERDFPGAAAFVDAWPTIRDEAIAVSRQLHTIPRFHELMPEQSSISANDGRDWRMYILKAYGVEEPRHMAECPTLATLVRQAPEVISASFSFIGPRKHIPPHRGPFRGILRFYLMLVMPRLADGTPAATLRVDDVDYRLNDGEFLLWDDTFEHEAWNDSDEVRIVLSLDVRRPHMPADMRYLSAAIIHFVRWGVRIRGLK